MNSPNLPDRDEVLEGLGSDFVNAYIQSVDNAREDYSALREWKTDWVPSYAVRTVASFIHDRIWYHLLQLTNELGDVSVIDNDPTRELYVGTKYKIRIKRHSEKDKISNAATASTQHFWSQGTLALDGMEEIRLALGYVWDREIREINDPVLSFRVAVDEPLWSVKLHPDSGSDVGYIWTPYEPDLPEIDISAVVAEPEEGEQV